MHGLFYLSKVTDDHIGVEVVRPRPYGTVAINAIPFDDTWKVDTPVTRMRPVGLGQARTVDAHGVTMIWRTPDHGVRLLSSATTGRNQAHGPGMKVKSLREPWRHVAGQRLKGSTSVTSRYVKGERVTKDVVEIAQAYRQMFVQHDLGKHRPIDGTVQISVAPTDPGVGRLPRLQPEGHLRDRPQLVAANFYGTQDTAASIPSTVRARTSLRRVVADTEVIKEHVALQLSAVIPAVDKRLPLPGQRADGPRETAACLEGKGRAENLYRDRPISVDTPSHCGVKELGRRQDAKKRNQVYCTHRTMFTRSHATQALYGLPQAHIATSSSAQNDALAVDSCVKRVGNRSFGNRATAHHRNRTRCTRTATEENRKGAAPRSSG